MSEASLKSLKELKTAINKSKGVMLQPRFGCSEQWIEVSKKTALSFLSLTLDAAATPDDLEFGTGSFGTVDADGFVWLG